MARNQDGFLSRLLRSLLAPRKGDAPPSAGRPSPSGIRRRRAGTRPAPAPRGFRFDYSPKPDGLPNPGEVVWTWVPYEDDVSQGKDRPVLLVGRDGGTLLGLMLTSKDHDRDAADEARYGRRWMDIGTGGWDRQRRPSEVRLDRLLRIDPAGVRREGAALDRARFDQVAAACAKAQGWS